MSIDQNGTSSDKPVLIVGAGPTGLVLGIELARRGIPFRLIDRMAEPAPWSAAIFVKPRSLELLAGLDLIDPFMAHGQIVEGVDIHLGAKQVAAVRFGDLDTPYPFILSIPEEQTKSLLTERLEQLSGRVERGVEFLGLEEAGDRINARLRSEVSGDELVEAAWVVGTDGYHSAVREAIGDPFDGKDYPELWGVVDTRIDGWRHPRSLTRVQLRPPNVIPFPLGTDRWRVYFRPQSDDPAAALDLVGEGVALVCPGAGLADPDTPQFFKSHSRLAKKFRKGRVLIAGDAAHGSNPIEGHGMNAGMQDAFNLGWKLALVASGDADDQLLASYEAERRPVDRAMVESGDEAYRWLDPGGEDLRQELTAILATAEGRSHVALADSEIAFAYDESPLAEDITASPSLSPKWTPRGGRIGEVTGLASSPGEQSLHDLIHGTSPSLFLLPGDGANPGEARALLGDAAACLKQAPACAFAVLRGPAPDAPVAPDVLYDPDGLLHDRLGDAVPCLCLIRPDGHLGFRSSPPSLDALRSYLSRIYRS